jgi:hypothetical protein
MLAGRNSVYDNDFYLSSTYPPPLSSHWIVLSASQRASMTVMHIFVQCPRLICLVRRAISNQETTSALVAAITLAESLWQLDIADQVAPLLSEAVTLSPRPVRGLADVLVNSLHFDSIQSMVLCTRYWMLITILGGLIDSLYRFFPAETELSLLPDRYVVHILETDAATKLAMSIPWANSLSQTATDLHWAMVQDNSTIECCPIFHSRPRGRCRLRDESYHRPCRAHEGLDH